MTHHIGIFISHSWTYSEHYDRLSGWILRESWNSQGTPINFADYSVPKDDPIHNAPNEAALRQAIHNEIRKSHIVIIPTGMYASHSKWIQKEIDGAQIYSRPILAVDPWGQEKKSSIVVSAAQLSVGWNKQSVIDGIWKLYRQHYAAI